MGRTAALLAAIALLAAPIGAGAQGRSFVGRKLPVFDYIDTLGHKIQPKHFEGSVLVVFGGIPW